MKSTKRNVIVSALLAITLCMSVLAGATFALFTSTAKVNLSITSAKVKTTASVENVKLYSLIEVNPDTLTGTETDRTAAGSFYLGGTADFNDGKLTLNRMAPGDKVTFDVKLVNESNIDVKYRITISDLIGSDLANVLSLSINGETYRGSVYSEWYDLAAKAEIPAIPVEVELPVSASNEWSDKTVSLDVGIEVYQATVDTTDNALVFDEDSEYNIKGITANGVDGVLQITNGTLTVDGAGKLIAKGGIYTDSDNKDHEYAMAIWARGDNTKVVINGGYFTQTVSGNDSQYDMIYAGGKNVVIEIYGGTFKSVTPKWTLNCKDHSGSKIYVMGGRYYKFNPAAVETTPAPTADDPDPKEVIVPDGYEVVQDGDWYEVKTKENHNFTIGAGGAYETLNDAIENAAKDSQVNVTLPENANVTLDNGIANEGDKSRALTFVGDGTQTMDVAKNAPAAEGATHLNYQRGSKFTFKNMTIQAGEGDFDGVVCDELVYENCTIKGKLTLYGKATFINCTFENTMANQYSIWTWGGTDVKFENCTFNTNGKAILLYGQATAAKPTNLVVNNCTFNDRKNGAAGKAAIEVGNDYHATYTLTINNITVNGFSKGKNTDSEVWANKNSMDAEHLTVTINGTKIQ